MMFVTGTVDYMNVEYKSVQKVVTVVYQLTSWPVSESIRVSTYWLYPCPFTREYKRIRKRYTKPSAKSRNQVILNFGDVYVPL